jgi:DNA polymerase-3 subunit epsilon
MSIAATSIVENRIILKDSFEIYIKHTTPLDISLDNEFITVSKVEKVSEEVAIEILIEYLGNSIFIGHRIDFDIEMLNQMLSRLKLGKLKNEAYDIEAMFNKLSETNDKKYAMEDMSKFLNISISERNSVADDAYSIAILFLKLKSKLGIK